MVRGAAGDKDEAAAAADDVEVGLETSEGDGVRVKVDAAAHRVDDGLGLLVDFFLHEVVKRPLHDGGELNLERLDGADGRHGAVVLAQAVDVELALGNVRDVVVLEVQDALGVLDDGRRVRRDEELDGLGHAVLGQERARLAAHELAAVRVGRRGDAEEAVGRTGRRTLLERLVGVGRTRELDVDKVNLELLLRLDTDQDRRTTTRDDNLIRVVDRLEDERERALLRIVRRSASAGALDRGGARRGRTSSMMTLLMRAVKLICLPFCESYRYLVRTAATSVSVSVSNL